MKQISDKVFQELLKLGTTQLTPSRLSDLIDATGMSAIDILFLGGIKEIKVINEPGIIENLSSNIKEKVFTITSLDTRISEDKASVVFTLYYTAPRYYKTKEAAEVGNDWNCVTDKREDYQYKGNKKCNFTTTCIGSDSTLEGFVEIIRKND